MVIPQQQGPSNRKNESEGPKNAELFQDVDPKIVDEIKDMNLEELLSYQKSLILTIDRLEDDLAKLKSSQLPLLIREHWNDLNALIEELEGYQETSVNYSSSKSSLEEG